MVKLSAVVWYLECDCGFALTNPLAGGSEMWASGDPMPEYVVCGDCGKKHKVPARIK